MTLPANAAAAVNPAARRMIANVERRRFIRACCLGLFTKPSVFSTWLDASRESARCQLADPYRQVRGRLLLRAIAASPRSRHQKIYLRDARNANRGDYRKSCRDARAANRVWSGAARNRKRPARLRR